MGYRDFMDASGTEWTAWDVVPRLVERRVAPRRATGPIAAMNSARHEDRRLGMDRRLSGTHRAFLRDGFDRGWLCFESSDEKRRLAPIPRDWLRCPTQRLAEYCTQGTHVDASARVARLSRAFPGIIDLRPKRQR